MCFMEHFLRIRMPQTVKSNLKGVQKALQPLKFKKGFELNKAAAPQPLHPTLPCLKETFLTARRRLQDRLFS